MTVEPIAVVADDPVAHGVWRYRDGQSGCAFVIATPGAMPALWDRYLQGALDVYRHYGVEDALEYHKIEDGRSASLFFLALDGWGEAVAGVRMQGPYADVGQVHALTEWAGQPGEAALRRMIAHRLPEGVIEVKGAWVARDAIRRSELSAAISRTVLHGAQLLGARYGFATVASFTVDKHQESGAVLADEIPAVPYPDERYRTVPLWWDTRNYRLFASELQCSLTRAEQSLIDASRTRPSVAGCRIGRGSESRHRYGR